MLKRNYRIIIAFVVLTVIRAEDASAIFHYHEKVYIKKRRNFMVRMEEETKRGGKFSHQILTKQLKVILGFESGKTWKE